MRELTSRQRQVLRLYGQGLGEKEIAHAADMSPSRVKQHVRALKDRLGTERRSGLVAAAAYLEPCAELSEPKSTVPSAFNFEHRTAGDQPDRALLSDFAATGRQPRWDLESYDRVGPGALDGQGAALKRAVLILLIGLGGPVLILLVQAAMVALAGMKI